ncbi:MAG TPA: sulfatase [Candidatus Brocadiia bacterium]|nr:sulfatase [Candidatus Brocadiia bacterium]
MERKPNLVVLFADQMRAHTMSALVSGSNGDAGALTPNLERLARNGVNCANAISNCPVCTPSRGSLITGRYPLRHMAVANDLQMPPGQTSIAEVLNRNGYRCGYIGKWHLDGIPRDVFTPPGPRRQGFDDYWAVFECHHDYFNTRYFLDKPDLVRAEGYEPDIQTNLAIEYIGSRMNDPFCLFVSWGPPHDPYQLVPEKYRAMFDPERMGPRPNCAAPDRRAVADYFAAVAALDECVGRIARTLEELGLDENTILVFTSDHGDMLWSHGRRNKQQPWEESIRIPLILSRPGAMPENAVRRGLIGVTDLPPTLLALCGIQPPECMEGLDHSRMLLEDRGPRHASVPIMDIVPTDQAKAWGGRPWRGVRTERYTYARYRDEGWVLYDNDKDPYQFENLIARPEAEKLRDEMEGELQKWLERMGDEFLAAEGHLEQLGLLEAWNEREAHFDRLWRRKK